MYFFKRTCKHLYKSIQLRCTARAHFRPIWIFGHPSIMIVFSSNFVMSTTITSTSHSKTSYWNHCAISSTCFEHGAQVFAGARFWCAHTNITNALKQPHHVRHRHSGMSWALHKYMHVVKNWWMQYVMVRVYINWGWGCFRQIVESKNWSGLIKAHVTWYSLRGAVHPLSYVTSNVTHDNLDVAEFDSVMVCGIRWRSDTLWRFNGATLAVEASRVVPGSVSSKRWNQVQKWIYKHVIKEHVIHQTTTSRSKK